MSRSNSKWDVGIPIAFPNYQVAVNAKGAGMGGAAAGVDKAAKEHLGFDPGLSKTTYKIGGLGHAGVLFIKNSGLTKYYEYGRYPGGRSTDPPGRVRKVSISNVTYGADGHPTKDSLKKVLGQISSRAGQNGRIEAAYVALKSGFAPMESYALKRYAQNNDRKRAGYTLTGNSCMHFAHWTVEAGGADLPEVNFPSPANWMDSVQNYYPDLTYSGKKLTLKALSGESSYVPSWSGSKTFWDDPLDSVGRAAKPVAGKK